MVEKGGINKKYNYAIIVGAVTLLGLVLVSLFVIKPLYSSAANLTKEAKDKQTNLDQLNQKKQKLEALKSRQEELTADSKTVLAALPDGTDVGRLFIQLDSLVKTAGGQVKSVQEGGAGTGTTKQSNVGSVKKVTFSMPADMPDYFSFKDLISKTESALRLVDINGLSITSNNGTINANLTIDTFTR